MTREEQEAFWHEQEEHTQRIGRATNAALSHYAELMYELMNDSQQAAIRSVMTDAIQTADYFGKRPLKTEVDISRVSQGRKGSPWATWWISVKVDTDSLASHAQGFAFIGKHGKVEGTIYEFGGHHELGKHHQAKKA